MPIRFPNTPLGRREAAGGLLASFVVVALAREARAAAPAGGGRVRRWVAAQQDIAESLAAGRLSGPAGRARSSGSPARSTWPS